MADVNFYLRDINAKETAVIAVYYFNGKRLKYYPGIVVPVDQWDARKQRVSRYHDHAVRVNNVLSKIRELIVSRHLDALARCETITPAQLKKQVDDVRGRHQESITVVSFVEQFISERKKDKRYRPGSITVYNTVLKHVKDFRPSLSFDDIDVPFFYSFVEYLYGKGFAQNYVQKVVSTIKTFLNDATDRGVNTNLKYKSRAFSVPKQAVYHIHLTEDELTQLYETKLTGSLLHARDCFIIQAYTGIRYSDLHNLKAGNFQTVDGKPVLRLIQWKTRDVVIIPRKPIVDQIWNKYGGALPIVSNQKMNEYVKEAARIAGIDQAITITRNVGGERIDETKYKWQLVTTHTGRRSCICNLYKEGKPVESIMKVSGHRSHASFMSYLKLSPEDHLKRMQD